jgi:hypothetical protein
MMGAKPHFLSPEAPAAPVATGGGAVQRFTVDGDAVLERRLKDLVDQVHHGVLRITGNKLLQGILLGGGYGRGEGGVLWTPAGDLPYNDLEFYVFLRGHLLKNRRKYQPLLHHLAEELTREAGLEIELKVFSLEKLRASPVSMFFYDLFMGHRWVHGGAELLAHCDHHAAAELIPLSEATRLLMNRGTGLLFAAEFLQRTEFSLPEADFVNRNLHKLRLALGDAILASRGQYHWSCRERHRRLGILGAGLPWDASVLAEHARGVEFKLHPFKSSASRAELAREHAFLSDLLQKTWLWLEGNRLGRTFGSAVEYVDFAGPKCPETSALRNVVLNLVYLRRNGLATALRHPKERVLDALALLLWGSREPETASRVQRLLFSQAVGFPEQVAAYRNLWSCFN